MLKWFSFPLLFFFSLALWPFSPSGEQEIEIKKSQLDIPPYIADLTLLRILILKETPSVTMQIEGAYEVFDHQGQRLWAAAKMEATSVTAGSKGIQVGNQSFQTASLLIVSQKGDIKIGKRTYRNAVTFWLDHAGKLNVNNELPVDDYLKGVLPWEANPKWPPEALKAQAIASRTYALFRAIERQDEPYDLSSDVMSQVYKGKDIEHEATDKAIESTKGLILTYRGKIFPAFFHSTCGGRTTRVENVWRLEPVPTLAGGECRFCQGSKHYRWQSEFSVKEMEEKLQKRKYNVRSITSLVAKSMDASGRPKSFEIQSQNGKIEIQSNDFRLLMDPARFKSTKINAIDFQNGKFLFSGQGWGHGVGMCQYGMKGLGEAGYAYRQILDYYYPLSDVIKVY